MHIAKTFRVEMFGEYSYQLLIAKFKSASACMRLHVGTNLIGLQIYCIDCFKFIKLINFLGITMIISHGFFHLENITAYGCLIFPNVALSTCI